MPKVEQDTTTKWFDWKCPDCGKKVTVYVHAYSYDKIVGLKKQNGFKKRFRI